MQLSKNNILLSFVLPVYNVELYLPECVDSIRQQMTDECEMILVNDGSTDMSGSICSEYAANDLRVRIIHKENGGLSSARNAGLRVAAGKYVSFIDSDDRLYSNSVAEILQWIRTEGTDLCFLQAEKFYPDGKVENLGEHIERDSLRFHTREEAIAYLASRPKYPGSAWAKLYRREFLLDNDLYFPNDRRYSEDLGFMRDCILCAKDFDSLPIPFYQYRQNRQGSITNSVSSKNFHDLFLFVEESVKKINVREKNDTISKSVMSFVAYEYSILLYLFGCVSDTEKIDSFEKLKQYSWTLKYAGNKMGKVTCAVCSLLGVRATSFLLGLYRKMRNK